jgi:hypothetical protein
VSVQAKFYVAEVTRQGYGGTERPTRKVKLIATSRKDESSRKFWEATPSGTFEMGLSGEAGAGAGLWFEARLGKSLILTFDDAPEEES